MPFVLLALGILFFVVSIQGTQGDFFTLLKSEFVGSNSFVVWAAALIILGLLGYIRPIRPITHAFMVLIVIVLVLANGQKFAGNLNSAIRAPTAPSAGSPSTSSPSTSSPSGGTGSLISSAQAAPVSGLSGSNFLGSALPDVLSGGYGGTPQTSGADTLIPNYDASGQWIGYSRP